MGLRLVGAAAALLACSVVPGTAAAAPGESGYLERLSATYRVSADGTIDVTETIDYRFSNPGTDQLTRRYRTRAPYVPDDSRDQVWEYTGFTASSPTGADARVAITEVDPHQQETGDDYYDSRESEVRVEFPQSRKSVTTARYVLSYRIRGALHAGALDRWTVARARPDRIEHAEVRVTAPGGAVRAACTGGSDDGCEARTLPDGSGLFVADILQGFDGMTISAEFGGEVTGDPILASAPSAFDKVGTGGVVRLSLAGLLLLVPLPAWFLTRHRGPRRLTGCGTRILVAVACLGVAAAAGLVAGRLVLAAGGPDGDIGWLVYGFGYGLLVTVVWFAWLCWQSGALVSEPVTFSPTSRPSG